MEKTKIDWKRKLTSRKLWVAVSNFIGMLLAFFGCSESVATQIVALIMAGAGALAYVIAEGWIDVKNAGAGNGEQSNNSSLGSSTSEGA